MARDVGSRIGDNGDQSHRSGSINRDVQRTRDHTMERDCSRERRETSPEDSRYSDSGGSDHLYSPPTQRRRRPYVGEQDFHRDYNDLEQGERLYRNFLRDQLHQSNLSPPRGDSLFSADSLEHDLASLAERFSRSEGREQVRERAEAVDLSTLNSENFNSLLTELFHDGGITQERLLVLFFFCSDLTIRACREGLTSLCRKITLWTLAFVRGTVTASVRIQGGWSRVLRGRMRVEDAAMVLGTTVALLTILYFYYRRSRIWS
eukprot:TRINITY_DN22985_c0_g1_i1.p1 TRINITY_DN22985_c0_g1~~TRINITY_DN22985_c0_g1_i1.p1  ORF type:complete len:262 (+),score=1.04 TRINITY_DN22985_c0_g1_i1:41-826(+)